MEKQHNRRLFKGYYKRFDGKLVYVGAIVADVGTGVQIVANAGNGQTCSTPYQRSKW